MHMLKRGTVRAHLFLGRSVRDTERTQDPRQQPSSSTEEAAREPTACTREGSFDSTAEEAAAPPEHDALMKAAQERRASQTEADSSDTEADADAEPAGSGRRGVGEPMTLSRAGKSRVLSDGATLFKRLCAGEVVECPFLERPVQQVAGYATSLFDKERLSARAQPNDLKQLVRVRLLQSILRDAQDPDHRGMEHF